MNDYERQLLVDTAKAVKDMRELIRLQMGIIKSLSEGAKWMVRSFEKLGIESPKVDSTGKIVG